MSNFSAAADRRSNGARASAATTSPRAARTARIAAGALEEVVEQAPQDVGVVAKRRRKTKSLFMSANTMDKSCRTPGAEARGQGSRRGAPGLATPLVWIPELRALTIPRTLLRASGAHPIPER